MHNIPTDLLRSFLSIIDTGSFTRAAERVGRTQSAVSLQIKRLEEVLGVRLFLRDAHNLRLTDEGTTFVQYARRILALNDEVLTLLHTPKVAGRIRFGAPYEYTASLLPDILGRFAQSHPNVNLEVTSDLTKNLLKRHEAGEFDLVIALHEGQGGGGRRVHTEPLVWITSVDHDRQHQVPLPIVAAPAPCIYRDRMLQTTVHQGVSVRIAYLSSSYDGIVAAVRAGLGVTAMARSTIPNDSAVLSEANGLPALGRVELGLHRASTGTAGDAIKYLEDYIIQSFGTNQTN